MLLAYVSKLKWWCNEPFPGSRLRRKMIKLTRQGGRRCANVKGRQRYCLAYYHGVVSLLFFHGLTFLQRCLFWLARHLWRVSWFSLWAHSPCPLWFVFLLFSSRPCSKWPVNRVTLGTGLLCFYRSVWTSDIGKPSRYVNMNSYLLVIVENVIFSSFGIKRPVFINIKCAVAELLTQLLFLWESGSTW